MRPTQPERTSLAAQRTGAATLVVSLVVLRGAVLADAPLAAAASGAAIGISLLELWESRRAYPFVAPSLPRAAFASAAGVALAAAGGLIVSLG